MDGLSWEDLDLMAEGDPLDLRDRAWAEIERLRARTHEIQAQEMAKRADLDSLVAKLRTRWDASRRWTEDEELLAEWAHGEHAKSPFWMLTSTNARDALARLMGERDDARRENAVFRRIFGEACDQVLTENDHDDPAPAEEASQ